ncbi:hypothetical protein MtrunA17_Chr1g0194981 [Medicago truncatula]|uniref:Transmembrane protein n=1 Tax=Medicago truncatula TaxID=3880 RepID=A0A396JU44_MEDTR|nr:hypothetical protein MtrunA17_Chr1g0194981 [Medicago truncatula]
MEVPFDVYKNDFEVAVKKRNVKVYFTDGWTFLKNFMCFWLVLGSLSFLQIDTFFCLKLGICMEMSWCILKALLHKECCCRTIVLMLT